MFTGFFVIKKTIFMKTKIKFLLVLIFLTSYSDEGKTDKELLDRDKKELTESLDSHKFTLLYLFLFTKLIA